MKRWLISIALLAATLASPISARETNCSISVEGFTYHFGACEIEEAASGITYIRSLGDPGEFGYWVHLDMVTETQALAHWNEVYGASHAHNRLGRVQLRGNCWRNERARICFDVPAGDTAVYHIEDTDETPEGRMLVASVQGREYVLQGPEWGQRFPVSLEERVDLDGDGREEQIVLVGLGGNGSPPSLSVVSYRGDGFFTFLTPQPIAGSWSGYEIVDAERGKVIQVTDVPVGAGSEKVARTQRTYAVRSGKLVRVAKYEEQGRRLTLKSLSVKTINRAAPRGTMLFDLNRDGTMDEVTCAYGERWGALACEVCFDGGVCLNVPSCKSIGVSRRISRGVHMLTCDNRDLVISDELAE